MYFLTEASISYPQARRCRVAIRCVGFVLGGFLCAKSADYATGSKIIGTVVRMICRSFTATEFTSKIKKKGSKQLYMPMSKAVKEEQLVLN